jgi:hypothetical protein
LSPDEPRVCALLHDGEAKIGAALEGLSVKAYIIKLVEAHWVEMEKKGILPKVK